MCLFACAAPPSAQGRLFRNVLPRGSFGAAAAAAGGNVHPLAQPRYDRGPVTASAETGKLRLLLKRSPEREAALTRFLEDVRDPHSPEYRKWLSPREYGARFGASEENLRTARAWLERQGFAVEAAPAGKSFLAFRGTVGQLNRAFSTSVHSYSVDGVEHHGNAAEPRMPAALSGIVRAVAPLNDFRARGQQLVSTQTRVQSKGPAGPLGRGAAPLLTDPSNGAFYFTPAEAATVYNAPNALNRNAPSGTQHEGAGVTIGIVGYSDLPVPDYLNYRQFFLGEAPPAPPTPVVDGIDPGVLDQHDGQVTLIAAEIAAALAPKATIYVYSSQSDLLEDGLMNAITRAVEDNAVSVLSLSYSTCEKYLGDAGNYQINELWKQAAAQGISVVVAAGDTGSVGCDDGGSATATQGLAVNGFASTAYDLAVGGTDFALSESDFASHFSPGGNSPSPVQASLAGYLPESAWNDSITGPPGALAANTAAQFDFGSGPTSIIVAGGGGLSSTAYCPDPAYAGSGACSASTTGYPQPSFQAGTASGQTVRTLPDVALFAGTHRQYQATWAICSDNQVAQASYTFTDCVPGPDGSFSIEGAGGTGTSAPAFAGILALVSESLGGQRLGLADNVLYRLANEPQQAVFHDITVGNNAVPCAGGSPDCGAGGFLNGYDAVGGYDAATGLGSVDISALIAAWPSVSFTPTNTVLTATPLTVTHGTPVTFTAMVTPGSPAGNVSITGPTKEAGAAVNELIQLTNGSGATITRKLPGGTYIVQGNYSGDVSHAASTSDPIQLTVNKENSVLRLSNEIQNLNDRSTTPNVASIPYGTYGFTYVQPVGASSDQDGPATGTVTLSNAGSPLTTADAPAVQTLNSVGRAAFPLDLLPPGSYQLNAAYGGDVSYNPSTTSSATALTVNQAATNLSAVSSAASVDYAASATITVTLNTDSTGLFPSGGITLTANGTAFPGTIRQVRTALNSDQEVAVYQVPASALASGVNTLTASYPGDANYIASSTSLTLTVTGVPPPVPTFTMAGPGGITLPSSQSSATGILSLQSQNGFAGTVQLACSFSPADAANAPQCAVTPSAVLTANGTATATVTISAPISFASNNGPGTDLGHPLGKLGGGFALASLFLLVPRLRRRVAGPVQALLIGLAAAGALGCGTHLNGHLRVPGSYTATVTGTSGSTVVSTQIVVQVQ